MKFIGILLGTILGIVVFLGLLTLFIFAKLKKMGKNLGFSNLKDLKSMIEDGEKEFKYNKKSVSGMTKLLTPKIVEDFPNFSSSELFNKVETSLLSIFKSLEEKHIEGIDELKLIKIKLKELIEDYKQNKTNVLYDDVIFHNHAIKYYKKNNGAMSITVSTSLEYYYEKEVNGKVINSKKDYKRQTSYTTEFIYVYDPEKYNYNENLIGINCPNCGAPVKSLKNKTCRYCGSGLEDINLKHWYLISYKEDYE